MSGTSKFQTVAPSFLFSTIWNFSVANNRLAGQTIAPSFLSKEQLFGHPLCGRELPLEVFSVDLRPFPGRNGCVLRECVSPMASQEVLLFTLAGVVQHRREVLKRIYWKYIGHSLFYRAYATMIDNLTSLALYFLLYASERLNCHS